MKRTLFYTFLITFLLLLSSCSNNTKTTQLDYKEIKGMVVDILKTDEGKKAVQDVLKDEKIKNELIIDDKKIEETVKKTLLSKEAADTWKKLMEDPKFAAAYAKALQKENESILKNLMNDPDYRKKMIETMKNPEYEKLILDILTSNAYRSQVMTVIKESVKSPIMQDDMLKLMIKANEEMLKPEKKEDKSSSTKKKSSGGSSK